MTAPQISELMDTDSGEEWDHGQTVRDTFPQADFFLRIDSDTDAKIIGRVQRFLHIILGTKVITPTKAERAMYAAASAAGNSACLCFEKSLEALPALEGIVLENLRKKNLIPEKKQNGTGN
jgi:hypothetical protein